MVDDRGDSALDRLGGAEHVAVAEEPDGGLNGGRPLIEVRQRAGFVCVRVVLVEDAGHVSHVRDVGRVPGAQGVAVADVGVSVDVDAIQGHLIPTAHRCAVNNAGKALILGRKIRGWDCCRVAMGRVEGASRVGYVTVNRLAGAGTAQGELGVGTERQPETGIRAVSSGRRRRGGHRRQRRPAQRSPQRRAAAPNLAGAGLA